MLTPAFTGPVPGSFGRGKNHPIPGFRPAQGTAQLADDGWLTVGSYADGQPARWMLTDAGRARHALIVGTTSSGATTLLRQVLDAAQAAGADTQAIDTESGGLGPGVHPAACNLTAARAVLAENLAILHTRLTEQGGDPRAPWPALRVLAIDGLHRLTPDRRFTDALATLVRLAPKAGIAVLASTEDPRLSACGGEISRTQLAAHTLVLLRTGSSHDTRLLGVDAAPVPACFADGTNTVGVGYLPRQRPCIPFRAWMP
ncbi:hypothetical protein [Actinoplanes subglobosus]|uniref:FtsK domain-containing protein n=1 Tax=Actinoplanes subglobosus TaxID=1547892 RepID=A0ABV8IYH2_9ACTN